MELEKTLRKAVRTVKGMAQLYEIRDTNAKVQKQPPVQLCSTPTFLQAGGVKLGRAALFARCLCALPLNREPLPQPAPGWHLT